MSNPDIDELKNKLKLFGQKSVDKLKELKGKIDEQFSDDSETKGDAEESSSTSPTRKKQPKNSFDRFLDKIPKVSIVIEKKSDKEEEASSPNNDSKDN